MDRRKPSVRAFAVSRGSVDDTSAAFQRALDFVLAREGGYSHDPRDLGGETNHGITANTLQRAIAAKILPASTTVRTLTREQAGEVYRAFYWAAVRAEEFPGPIGFALFDAAVNLGPGQAVRQLQRAMRVDEDGLVGDVTIRAAWSQSVGSADARAALLEDLLGHRLEYYRSRSTASTFFRGWAKRVLGLQRAALGL